MKQNYAMKYSMLIAATLALVALVEAPATMQAQSKEVLATKDVQREVFALEGKVEAFQTSQAERLSSLEALLNQAMASNKSLAAGLDEMKKSLTQSLTEQQTRIAEPVSTLRGNIEEMSQSVTSLRESVGALDRRTKANDDKIDEILRTVRALLAAPAAAPPPANPTASASPGAAPANDGGTSLFLSATRDYIGGKDDRAMEQLRQFVNTYASSPDAPQAMFLIGKLYDRAGQNEDAIQAFDRVLEQYPENPTKPDALFEKAELYVKSGKKPEALKEFNSFLKRYPSDPNASIVKERVKLLEKPAAAPSKPSAAKSKSKRPK